MSASVLLESSAQACDQFPWVPFASNFSSHLQMQYFEIKDSVTTPLVLSESLYVGEKMKS